MKQYYQDCDNHHDSVLGAEAGRKAMRAFQKLIEMIEQAMYPDVYEYDYDLLKRIESLSSHPMGDDIRKQYELHQRLVHEYSLFPRLGREHFSTREPTGR